MTQKHSIIYTELKKFGNLTSVKGVGRAIKSECQCLKVMWAFSVILLLSITVYNVWSLTREYMMYHTGTKITEKKKDMKDTGSDVLLCNINPYSTSSLNRTLKQKDLYQKLITEWTRTTHQQSKMEIISLNSIKQELLTGQFGFYQHIGFEEASYLSHTWRDFMKSCHIHYLDGVMEKTVPCSYSNLNIEKFKHKDYFNCYKLFGESQKGSRLTTGMSFLLYIDDIMENDNIRDLSIHNSGKGAKLAIGESGTFLNPNTHGVEILPKYVNIIRFKILQRLRLPKPHGECIERNAQHRHGDRNMLGSLHNDYSLPYLYTEDGCLSACIEYNIIQTCKCQDVGQYGILLHVFNNFSMCGSTDQGKDTLLERMRCIQKWRNIFRTQCLPKCPSPCKEKKIDSSVTYLEISPQHIKEKLREEQQKSSVPHLIGDGQDKMPHYNNLDTSHFAWVYLKRHRTSYYVVEDTKGMTIYDWLAKVGGAMNLWSGITVFVLIEIADLLCRLVKRIFTSEMSNVPRAKSECQCKWHCNCNADNTQTMSVSHLDVGFRQRTRMTDTTFK